jgi:hypothetical protein
VKYSYARRLVLLAVLASPVVATSWAPSSARGVAESGQSPSLTSVGPLAFAADGTLFAADNLAASVYALDLGTQATGAAPGAKGIDNLDQALASLLGTAATEIAITDLAVHPRSRNAFVSVMRGQGAAAAPALFRIDGNGKIDLVSMPALKFSKVDLPNAPTAATGRRNPRADTVTDMALVDGKLWVAGLSNEEFASKLRAIPYPFNTVDRGTSVEIFHGNHAAVETRSPVYTFVPYTVGGQANLIAGYLCTPLVKFALSGLKPGEKVRGTTIAELGAGNRPIDMLLYKKNGADFLLMSNTSRGVMKISTAGFATAAPITEPVTTPTGGVAFETVASMRGIEQMDLLDAQNSIVLARGQSGVNLQVVPLP